MASRSFLLLKLVGVLVVELVPAKIQIKVKLTRVPVVEPAYCSLRLVTSK